MCARSGAVARRLTATGTAPAADWYARACAASPRLDEKAEYATQAVRQALAAADYATAVSLIEDNALSLMVQWYARTLEAWITALPPEWRSKSPKTSLAFAWNYLLHGQIDLASPYIQKLSLIFGPEAEFEDPALHAECPKPKRTGTTLRANVGVVMDAKYSTILKDGSVVNGHDDWHCVQDLAAAGYFTVGPERVEPKETLHLSELGKATVAALRQHKADGGNFAGFSPIQAGL